jgi:hypothetical protein
MPCSLMALICYFFGNQKKHCRHQEIGADEEKSCV